MGATEGEQIRPFGYHNEEAKARVAAQALGRARHGEHGQTRLLQPPQASTFLQRTIGQRAGSSRASYAEGKASRDIQRQARKDGLGTASSTALQQVRSGLKGNHGKPQLGCPHPRCARYVHVLGRSLGWGQQSAHHCADERLTCLWLANTERACSRTSGAKGGRTNRDQGQGEGEGWKHGPHQDSFPPTSPAYQGVMQPLNSQLGPTSGMQGVCIADAGVGITSASRMQGWSAFRMQGWSTSGMQGGLHPGCRCFIERYRHKDRQEELDELLYLTTFVKEETIPDHRANPARGEPLRSVQGVHAWKGTAWHLS
jgi:hypothetical protein